jgi:excinuclease ABC subunit A
MGPGAGDEGGEVVGFGKPEEIGNLKKSKTAVFLKRKLGE